MNHLFIPPISIYLSFFLIFIALVAIKSAVRRFMNANQVAGEYACSIWFIRGMRCVLIAATLLFWAAGFFFNSRYFFLIGLIILCQELYEGLMIVWALKIGAKIEKTGSRRVDEFP